MLKVCIDDYYFKLSMTPPANTAAEDHATSHRFMLKSLELET